ncbi:Type III secretion system lipoprotein chaperone (YscW) [Ferrimonas sediminum]|uniref:Type III secretion system lipoprotein chaperone (YscW) n=1 Tax=Ferrimonas sediminum TaxID=718193 RepID=A0A1G8LGI7_9GAMM|nr:YbaY family lipoprotein [Ferrimonas sediminum]SDI54745.1 Type III secretion system lipoprotein chaperone (YscW) [Ferrimonas sediminum]
MYKSLLTAVLLLLLNGCVTVSGPELEHREMVSVAGLAGANGVSTLPQEAVITVAIIDAKVPGSILAQKRFSVAKLPALFKFQLPRESIDDDADYVVVAMLKIKDKLVLQTYQRYPVITNGEEVATVTMEALR